MEKPADNFQKTVEWSEEDGCFVGRCPGVMLGGVHGVDRDQVFETLCLVVQEWQQILKLG